MHIRKPHHSLKIAKIKRAEISRQATVTVGDFKIPFSENDKTVNRQSAGI